MKTKLKTNILIGIIITSILFLICNIANEKTLKISKNNFLNSRNVENAEEKSNEKNSKLETIVKTRKKVNNQSISTLDLVEDDEEDDKEDDEVEEEIKKKPTTLKIIKKDGQEALLLENAKFTIKK